VRSRTTETQPGRVQAAEVKVRPPREERSGGLAEWTPSRSLERPGPGVRDPEATRRYGKAVRRLLESQPPPRPGGVIASTEASDTRVSARAILERIPGGTVVPTEGKPPWILKVSYRVEYRSGLRPVGVSVLTRQESNPTRGSGSDRLGPGAVNTGMVRMALPVAEGPIYVEVFADSRFDTTLGVGRTVARR
jgi:hypothetical protein